jgi:cytochrome c biogenesis protein ResB
MNNRETLTTSHTQDKINTSVNRRNNIETPSVYSSVYFVLCLVYPMLSVSLFCSLLIVPSVYSSVYLTLATSDTQDTEQNKH